MRAKEDSDQTTRLNIQMRNNQQERHAGCGGGEKGRLAAVAVQHIVHRLVEHHLLIQQLLVLHDLHDHLYHHLHHPAPQLRMGNNRNECHTGCRRGEGGGL